MPEQDPKVRARNFLEVPEGYTVKMAQEEAARCLQCKKPSCVQGCPVGVDIPGIYRPDAPRRYDRRHPQSMGEKRPAGGLRPGLSAGKSM